MLTGLQHGVEQLAVVFHLEGAYLAGNQGHLAELVAEVVVKLCRPPGGTKVEPSLLAEGYLYPGLCHSTIPLFAMSSGIQCSKAGACVNDPELGFEVLRVC